MKFPYAEAVEMDRELQTLDSIKPITLLLSKKSVERGLNVVGVVPSWAMSGLINSISGIRPDFTDEQLVDYVLDVCLDLVKSHPDAYYEGYEGERGKVCLLGNTPPVAPEVQQENDH